MPWLPAGAAGALIALAAGGCAAGSTATTGPPTSGATGTAGPITATTSTGTGTRSTGTGTSAQSPPGSAHRSGRTSPAAPTGLVTSAGYGTYELCAGRCSGSVPAGLRRPLRLPAADGGPCPVTIRVNGPVMPSTGTVLGLRTLTGSSWMAAPVTWTATGAYTGPVLIRGGQIGGPAPVGFGPGQTPYDELQLLDAGRQAPSVPGGRAWATYTRLPGPGCYAYQVDGTGFTEVIVFRAV